MATDLRSLSGYYSFAAFTIFLMLTTKTSSACTNGANGCGTCLDAITCQTCQSGFGKNGTQCVPCLSYNCIDCYSDYAVCQQCRQYQGVGPDGLCQSCDDFGCVECARNSSYCTFCTDTVGAEDGLCVPCKTPNCVFCFRNASYCDMCWQGYGLSAPGVCTKCLIPQCLHCSLDYSACIWCINEGYGLNPSGTCSPCAVTKCAKCIYNYTNCLACIPGYTPVSNVCVPCNDPKCTNCWPADTCHACADGYGTYNYKCRPCAAQCLTCAADQYEFCTSCVKTKYAYTGLCVSCPYHCLTCARKFASDVYCITCQIQYELKADNLCYKRKEQGFKFTFENMMELISYTIVVLSWMSFLFGLLTKRIAGLDAIIVSQFCVMTLAFSNKLFYLFEDGAYSLKYSTGFNANFYNESVSLTYDSKATDLFNFSQQYFSNNFNISIIFVVIPLIYMVFNYNKINNQVKQNPNLSLQISKSANKQHDKTVLLMRKFDNSLQYSVYGFFSTFVYFVSCFLLFLKCSSFNDSFGLVIISAYAIVGVPLLFKLISKPEYFSSFKSGFHHDKEHYFIIYIIVLIISLSLNVFVPSSYALTSLIPCLCLLAYTFLARPYIELRQNYRVCFSLVVMCLFIGFKGYLELSPNQSVNTNPLKIFLLIDYILLIILKVVNLLSTLRYRPFKREEVTPKMSQSQNKQRLLNNFRELFIRNKFQSKSGKISNQLQQNSNSSNQLANAYQKAKNQRRRQVNNPYLNQKQGKDMQFADQNTLKNSINQFMPKKKNLQNMRVLKERHN